ncbi:MAG: P27 family phage terminase small subunit [Clostridiales bacterium]|nr:P27 family phage terminase small subunit [Clostridiales bacterium]
MAKDGTNRGGRRVRAGEKPEPLANKIITGKAAMVLEVPDFQPETALVADELEDTADLLGADMPAPSDYLSSRQKDGKPLEADALYVETWKWLKARGCEKFVNPRLIESYAQAFTRYIQCEEAISTYGFLGKHPTTGGAIASPFVQMSQSFQKQANLVWYEIFDIVKQNCTTAYVGNPQDDIMEALLSGRKG